MGLLDTIKSLLGLGGSDDRRNQDDVGVTVEREAGDEEPRTGSESAVKAPAEDAVGGADDADDAVAADTEAAASTGTMVDDDVDTPDEAAEPGEAVGVGGDNEPAVDTEPPETDDAVAAGGDAAASTGSMVDENVADEAAEPAEAVDVTEATEEAESADDAEATDDETDAADTGDDDEADDGGDAADTSPDVLKGIGPAYARRLADAGIETVGDLAVADVDEVAEAIDVSPKRVSRWIDRAKAY